MTIAWGAVSGHLRVGIEYVIETPDHSDTDVRVYLNVYVGTTATWTFSDTETYSIGGNAVSASGTFLNNINGSNVTKLIYQTNFLQAVHYGYGDSINFTASISGMYNGGTPSASVWFGMPARPAAAPDAPSAPSVSPSGNTLHVTWSAPDDQGSAITSYSVQRSEDPSHSNMVEYAGLSGTSTTISGLAWATTYYARVRATNAAGTSGWSGWTSAVTGAHVPDAPAAPTVSAITPVTASASWSPPANTYGSPVTSYDVQTARDSGFTTSVVTAADPASPAALASLLPGTDYWVRVRATNGAGTGAWSAARQFKTLPGVHVGNGTAWVDSLMWVGNGTAWVLAQVNTGNGTAWK